MSDYSDLKLMAEHATGWTDMSLAPDVILALIADHDELADLRARLAASNTEVVAMVESALRRSFSLGQVYWQQADSDSTCQQNKSDQTMEVQAQHILNVVKSIKELI